MALSMLKSSVFCLLVLCTLFLKPVLPEDAGPETEDSCFCQLKGDLDDCECSVESIDSFNNLKIQPRFNSLLEKDYFRFYKLNLFRKCPFETDSTGKCGSKSCAVEECNQDELPSGLKENNSHSKNKYSKGAQGQEDCKDSEDVKEKVTPEENCEEEEEEGTELGDLDPHISDESLEAFKSWKKHDDEQENFCELDDEDSPEAAYYDLILNPERFTGYMGPSAVNVWKLIYDQNCFKPDQKDYEDFLHVSPNKGLCLEKRVMYRMISGFHTSINVDVTANWLIPAKNGWGQGTWGPNLEEFQKRFNPELTWGEGPQRLKNMYFTFLVELRALAKAAPYLQKEVFYTGDEADDAETANAVSELLESIKSFQNHFDERQLFRGDAQKLKEDFKVNFRNISRIMDCVGCDKCRMWGKLQITGMGTALKILFSGDSMGPQSTVTQADKKDAENPFQLTRGEIVALFNSVGRLSKSIHEVDSFRKMLS